MKRFVVISFLALLFYLSLLAFQPQSPIAEQILKSIPIVDSFKVIDNDPLFQSTYEVWFRVPLDHNNPNGFKFPLRAYYSHRSFTRPMVVVIDGYTMYTSRSNELTRILEANQLTIEHRFFSKSKPADSIPWSYLNISQAAADAHTVISAFKPHYQGKWVSTGISKSGQATIFHRRFYPNDVDVSVPYVAPLNFSSEDRRVYEFLSKVGSAECREKIREFQIALFKNKKTLLPKLECLAKKNSWQFTMGISRAYDLSVLEYEFAFWQWGYSCNDIPAGNSQPSVLFEHWSQVNPFIFFEEKEIERIRPFFYQAMTQIGMYGYNIEPFRNHLPDKKNITFEFTLPKGHTANFDSTAMLDVYRWVRDSGNYMLYIYGKTDAWSSTAVDPGTKTKTVKMVCPAGSHSTRIKDFPKPLRDSIYITLERWLEMPVSRK
ncbi:MAG TPA: peptidase [Bacteroidales bacterium]|nr:peptidase [Bacteroidales bacterium]